MISKAVIRARTFSKANKGDLPCFKYFINKSTVLGVYREAMLMTRNFEDDDMRESMK